MKPVVITRIFSSSLRGQRTDLAPPPDPRRALGLFLVLLLLLVASRGRWRPVRCCLRQCRLSVAYAEVAGRVDQNDQLGQVLLD